MIRQFTATIYIIEQGKVLLHRHRKIGRWLPPGGHVEPNETPPEAALREAKEETGLDVQILPQENLWLKAENASSFERPFLCLLEEIPPVGIEPAHQHMDFIYIGTLKEKGLAPIADFKWFGWEDLEKIKTELFPDTWEVLKLLLTPITTFDYEAGSL